VLKPLSPRPTGNNFRERSDLVKFIF